MVHRSLHILLPLAAASLCCLGACEDGSPTRIDDARPQDAALDASALDGTSGDGTVPEDAAIGADSTSEDAATDATGDSAATDGAPAAKWITGMPEPAGLGDELSVYLTVDPTSLPAAQRATLAGRPVIVVPDGTYRWNKVAKVSDNRILIAQSQHGVIVDGDHPYRMSDKLEDRAYLQATGGPVMFAGLVFQRYHLAIMSSGSNPAQFWYCRFNFPWTELSRMAAAAGMWPISGRNGYYEHPNGSGGWEQRWFYWTGAYGVSLGYQQVEQSVPGAPAGGGDAGVELYGCDWYDTGGNMNAKAFGSGGDIVLEGCHIKRTTDHQWQNGQARDNLWNMPAATPAKASPSDGTDVGPVPSWWAAYKAAHPKIRMQVRTDNTPKAWDETSYQHKAYPDASGNNLELSASQVRRRQLGYHTAGDFPGHDPADITHPDGLALFRKSNMYVRHSTLDGDRSDILTASKAIYIQRTLGSDYTVTMHDVWVHDFGQGIVAYVKSKNLSGKVQLKLSDVYVWDTAGAPMSIGDWTGYDSNYPYDKTSVTSWWDLSQTSAAQLQQISSGTKPTGTPPHESWRSQHPPGSLAQFKGWTWGS